MLHMTYCEQQSTLISGKVKGGWRVIRSPGRVSVVGTDGPGFPSPKHPYQPWGPPSHLYNVYWCPFPRGKEAVMEVNHSSQSIAEAKNEWSCKSTSPIHLHGADKENLRLRGWVQNFPAGHTKAAPNEKCCEGYTAVILNLCETAARKILFL